MASREQILGDIRKVLPEAVDLPDPAQFAGATEDDVVTRFVESLESVGGEAVVISDTSQIEEHLRQHPEFASAKRVVSLIEQPDLTLDPNGYADVDFAIVPGEFGVAENGAIWLTEDAVPHRSILFLAQHLSVVVSADELIENMHNAYQRVEFSKRRFGIFISGPSKTADIEQSLVIGAQGARSMTVFVVDPKANK